MQDVRELRQDRGFPDAVSEPRFGPIARTYLDRIPYLACIIRDINADEDIEIDVDKKRHDFSFKKGTRVKEGELVEGRT